MRGLSAKVACLTYHPVACLTLLFTLLQAVNQLGLNYVETLHRVSVRTVMDATVLSTDVDYSTTLTLLASLCVLQLLTFPRVSGDSRKGFSPRYAPALLTMLASIVFLLGEARIVFPLVLSSVLAHAWRNPSLKGFVKFAVLFAVSLSLASLARWLTCPLLPTPFYSDFSWVPSKIDKTLFYFLNNALSPLLATMLILSWLLSLVYTVLKRIRLVEIGKGGIRLVGRGRSFESPSILTEGLGGGRLLRILLDWRVAFAISLASLVTLNYYAYSPQLNPAGKPASVDILYTYVPGLEKFESYGLTLSGFNYLFTEWLRRPFVFLSLFLLKVLTGFNSVETVKLSLLLAGVLHVFSTFLALRLATGDRLLSTASVYFTTFSVATVVGLYAGYLGMWVSASFQLLSIAFLTRAVEAQSFKLIVPAALFSVLAYLAHPWSWLLFLLAVAALPIAVFFLKKVGASKGLTRRQLLIMAVFLLVQLVPEALAIALLNPPSLVKLVSDALRWGGFSIANLFLYGRNLNRMLDIYVGGFSNNWLIYLLSVVGAFSLLKYDSHLFTFILSATLISTPVFFLCDYRPQTRIIYFLPLQVASTIGFFETMRVARDRVDTAACFSLTVLLLANYAFRSIANLV